MPARDEAERLPLLLEALASQDVDGLIPIVVALNNTTDSSLQLLQDFRRSFGDRLAIHVDDHVFPPSLAHAGSARRQAMDLAVQILADTDDAVVLTTDADARPPETWISENLRAIAQGAHIVGGRLVIDELEPLPDAVAAARADWDMYWTRVREIEDAMDPRPWDPAPRHGDHTGASLAITAGMYRKAGGVPIVALGEDRALVNATIAAGGRLAHPMGVWTRVSPRRVGRAEGGMAKAMVELHDAVAANHVILAPALDQWRTRAIWRRAMRESPDGDARVVQAEELLPPMPCDTPLADMVGRL